jgi:hypothetical protein
MKLYTEEEIRKLLNEILMLSSWMTSSSVDDAINSLTPIELPTDDEVEEYSDRYSTMHEDVSDKLGKYLVSAIHIDGAKWMKEQILKQNK